MVLKTFTIRDSKGEFYSPPFFQKTHGEAERSFKQLVQDQQSQVSKFPEDYDLYYIGEFDDNTGKLIVTGKLFPSHDRVSLMRFGKS